MKLIHHTQFVFIAFLFVFSNSYSQVSIGTLDPPISGALLQLKDNSNTDGTSLKGLGMPRVALGKIDQLFPMLSSNPDYVAGTTKQTEDKVHTGLFVYNTNECLDYLGEYKGLTIWNGTKWELLAKVENSLEVQMFMDQDNKPFRARHFKTEDGTVDAGIWMIENLNVTKYAENIPLANRLTIDMGLPVFGSTSVTERFYSFPAARPTVGHPDGKNRSYYDQQPIMGLLYTWMTVTNNSLLVNGVIQGICPEGWYVPSDQDWWKLHEVMAKNPQPYSSCTPTTWEPSWVPNTGGWIGAANPAFLLPCSPPGSKTIISTSFAKSLSVSKGGFAAMPVGLLHSTSYNEVYGYGAYFWTATRNNLSTAWMRKTEDGKSGFYRGYGSISGSHSIRCKKISI